MTAITVRKERNVRMTIFETIKDYDEDMMAEFLYRFSKDTIDMFGRFIMPSKEGIIEFLERECPEK